ncbi:uncharacterized protein C16orf52 homolog A [Eurytemora carolleeae]|uniref:uncharacterized protein C16orf52 homolog A n=1 Tax=Eurytemora carolleeae TaxID=1294199 RepID=UPI000C78230F|nr:uncharacterized protein C16orf52 homolog A [Eurytemora carolleeae]|eukprot:XP_023340324.1 uncharacterized protein C16orf52 homolog A-like [Eurytemora affinis]
MDKLALMSGALFLAADIFAVTSLAMPDWITTEVGGSTRLGLLQSCLTVYNRPSVCYTPDLSTEWWITLISILSGCGCITTTLVLLLASLWGGATALYAKWVGFAAVIFFCIAAVMFPVGFANQEIGGAPYQLPNSYQVGISYIFFVMALWTTVISELFASKICLPHF